MLALAMCLAGTVTVTLAKISLFHSESGVTPPQAKARKVWLYTSIAADYDGAALLPHFISHYRGLGVKPENFLVVVNHNPEKTDMVSKDPVGDVTTILDSHKIKYRLWLDQYSSEKLLKIRYEMLNSAGWDDWIIHADSDEFHDYGTQNLVKFFEQCDKEGINEIKGFYLDRVSATGELTQVTQTPHLFQQYPMKCQVIKSVTGGRDTKAMAYKGYWRSDRGNHQVLRPAKAMTYTSGSPYAGATSGRGVVDAEDLYQITPYARRPQAYLYQCQENDVLENIPLGSHCYTNEDKSKLPTNLLSRKSKTATVYHFKWHAGVVANVKDRLRYYKGDTLPDQAGGEAKPRYDWYKDSESILGAVVAHGGVDLKALNCKL